MSDKEAYARYADQPPRRTGIVEHWCDHPGCKRWGCFGHQTRYGTLWLCLEHRGDADEPSVATSGRL